MDQFEVLVGNYGIKPQGKSAPMAAVKSGIKAHNSKPANSWNSSDFSSSRSKPIIDNHDDPFLFNSGPGFQNQNNGGFGDFDFGFPSITKNDNGASTGGNGLKIDVELMFRDSLNVGPKPSNSNDYDDLFGFSGEKTSQVYNDDLLSSTPKKVNSVDDFLGNLGDIGSGSTGSVSRLDNENGRNKFDFKDELIPGFGQSSATKHSMNKNPKTAKKRTQEASFIDIESSSANGGQYEKKEDDNEWDFQAAAPANDEVDLDTFFTTPSANSSTKMSTATSEIDIDSIFSVPNPRTTRVGEKQVPVQKAEVDIDSLFGAPKVKTGADVSRTKSKHEATPDLFSGTSSHPRNNISSSSAAYEFDLMFGGSKVSEAFKEIEGEDKDRRRARHDIYLKTQARMAQALADMNSREFQAQQEQEERHRIAETKDSEMKLWAASKEGNLRALISSLHQVLWPECDWKPVSLTDLITSSQVKLAYKRAALCVHPDKVQQRGATVQQKYVAEKVFDLLKEAWNKFNQEELR